MSKTPSHQPDNHQAEAAQKASLKVPAARRRRLCVEADADPRTVARMLRGEPVRGMVSERIRKAAKALGVELP